MMSGFVSRTTRRIGVRRGEVHLLDGRARSRSRAARAWSAVPSRPGPVCPVTRIAVTGRSRPAQRNARSVLSATGSARPRAARGWRGRDRSRRCSARAPARSSRSSCTAPRRARCVTRKPWAKPAGIHSMLRFASGEHVRSPLPEWGELLRMSTATSKISPAITRTSLPCGWRSW